MLGTGPCSGREIILGVLTVLLDPSYHINSLKAEGGGAVAGALGDVSVCGCAGCWGVHVAALVGLLVDVASCLLVDVSARLVAGHVPDIPGAERKGSGIWNKEASL